MKCVLSFSKYMESLYNSNTLISGFNVDLTFLLKNFVLKQVMLFFFYIFLINIAFNP